MIKELMKSIADAQISEYVDSQWELLSSDFRRLQDMIPAGYGMARLEISFHEDTKLLGYLTLLSALLPGDIVEIGCWKGKSLAFMNRLKRNPKRVIGIDPLEIMNQHSELNFYKENLFSDAVIISSYSELALDKLLQISSEISLLHIDGGHLSRNVLLDFLLYERNVAAGGYILFDDYGDSKYSPEVGPAVDLLRVGGLFRGYTIFGRVPGFENSYLLQKK